MATDVTSVYEFGDFRLDVRERQLVRNGQPIALTVKAFDTLALLVGKSGQLVTREELIRHLWPETVVEDNNLTQHISALRRALGEQHDGGRFIETVPRIGYRFVAGVTHLNADREHRARPAASTPLAAAGRQEIRFCTTADRTRIAYATVGTGPPLVKTANWLTHLEHEWDSPVWGHWIRAISRRHRLVRWDERGSGLSDWNAEDLSLDAWVRDTETVVDALGLERFSLMGISQGGAVAIAYAVRHPERVSHLVLCGAYARGWRLREKPGEIEARTALFVISWFWF
jgi:DNA-binding winged helix-turn-helix (wHTH) protein